MHQKMINTNIYSNKGDEDENEDKHNLLSYNYLHAVQDSELMYNNRTFCV